MLYPRCLLHVAALVTLGACAVTPSARVDAFSRMPTGTLWSKHALTSSGLDLAFIEAELASRGQRQSSIYRGRYLGQRTLAAKGRQLYTRTSIASDLNCSDFPSSFAAQKAFLAAGGPVKDPNGLDRDGDGLACEWGTYLQRSVTSYKASVRKSRARASVRRGSSRCYVGPRGGTYTITASGNKNYSGC